ncbi:hypothetical protein Q5762_19925 [Streptomyces sp. P9(2023)]|uniref:hypothetical protein n=1 Tax=Streptomyces sp. P9(2023) TaxID=3064394 RepID=UPI0028F40E8D|nr:hypothetical protein [Streptomyces sp. P9(2023)]MDT9690570.1 hypothetical protein [Streptomyces sp. P9(2023)]
MNRRSLPVAAALTAVATLTLTACGGTGQPNAGDKIGGVDTTPTSAAPSPSATPGSERPKITLPADVMDEFQGWKTGDATKDRILSDAAQARVATNFAVTQGNPEEKAMAFYRQGDALISGMQWVQQFVDAKLTYTGTVRYYDPKIELFDKSSAGLVYCSDESQAFGKERASGKVNKTPATKNNYILYSTRLELNKQGVWQTTKMASVKGHQSCTP